MSDLSDIYGEKGNIMNINMLTSKLAQKNKGQWFKAVWISDVPVKASAKRNGIVVNKMTYATVRYGIDYTNMKSTKTKIMNGELNPTHELPWGKWVENKEGIFIEHTNKNGDKNIYLRLYSSPNKSRVKYFLNGKPIEKEKLMNLGYVQDSVWKKSPSDCFTINVTNISEIF